MRFLHLADVHLDTPFAGRTPELRRRLREASREALARAFRTARAEAVDAVLLAGDLVDGERLSLETEAFLRDALRGLAEAGITVVYATGNHDPGRSGRLARLEWPERVVVADGPRPRRVAVERAGREVGFVTAVGHATARERDDLAGSFPPPASLLPEVALLHTQVLTARDVAAHDRYAPCDLRTLRRSGYHYWALGHVHTRQCLHPAEPAVHYPGNLQGRTPRESGPRGGLLVDLAHPAEPRVEFRAFAPVRWETLEVSDLREADTLGRIVDRVRRGWAGARRDDPDPGAEWIVRVALRGASPLHGQLREEEERRTLEGELAAALGVLDVEVPRPRLHPVVPVEESRRRTDVLGQALRLLEEVRAGEATIHGLDPDELAGPPPEEDHDPDAWVRKVLEDAEGEILARLLVEEG